VPRKWQTNTLGRWPPDDPLYFIDPNAIELGDLGLRHPIIRQGANATELGRRNMQRLAFDRRPPFDRLRFRRGHSLRRHHWHHRRDHENAGLASRLLLGRGGAIQSRCRRLRRRRPRPRLEQIFRVLTRSIGPLAITIIGRP
jgi:hypothetical protein